MRRRLRIRHNVCHIYIIHRNVGFGRNKRNSLLYEIINHLQRVIEQEADFYGIVASRTFDIGPPVNRVGGIGSAGVTNLG